MWLSVKTFFFVDGDQYFPTTLIDNADHAASLAYSILTTAGVADARDNSLKIMENVAMSRGFWGGDDILSLLLDGQFSCDFELYLGKEGQFLLEDFMQRGPMIERRNLWAFGKNWLYVWSSFAGFLK